ncbi:MAG TPA: VWA domain-containing protein [Pyrinomonadaceae bacterium]|nr:VWA domain-containing protein [Pyrinomonadaceae bacterium]
MNIFFRTLIIPIFLLVAESTLFAQSSCLTSDDIKAMLDRANSGKPATLNKKLEENLVELAEKHRLVFEEVLKEKNDNAQKQLDEIRVKSSTKFCQLLKRYGWPTTSMVEIDGIAATFHLLQNTAPFEMQRDLLPVVRAAAKFDENQKPQFAGIVDRLRANAGQKQLFGTLAVPANGLLVLYPIEDEKHVEERRKQAGLPPLPDYLRALEQTYRTPLIRAHDSPGTELSDNLKKSLVRTLDATLMDTPYVGEDDVIRVDTNLVSLDVSVFNVQAKSLVGTLQKEDFRVFEDGHEEPITYFASTDMPFDLVLLIDLSGSTAKKRDLIRESTQRFIQAARPTDRMAIVTFSDSVDVLCGLTKDRAKLQASLGAMDGEGPTNAWDALKFTVDSVFGPRTLERRRAVIMISDGADNALMFFGNAGSKISFSDLLESVRHSDVLIVPIYLDINSDYSGWAKSFNENARKTLKLLASESGGSFYKAKKLSDLDGVYEQVINDLGKVYSLGYKPLNERRDGEWRKVEVQIYNRPDLAAHSRPGYYAK